ncbi:MAG: T9SS type A sorting domain-containing protein [Saprospiraceae bacterium]
MKFTPILFFLYFFPLFVRCQQTFTLSQEYPSSFDYISDVVQIDDKFYFLQMRHFRTQEEWDANTYSDILVTSLSGTILDTFNLKGLGNRYSKFLKIDGDIAYLIGSIKSDSCLSTVVISKFNLVTHQLDIISSYELCDSHMQFINLIQGLKEDSFIEGIEYNDGLSKFFLKIDSAYTLTKIVDHLPYEVNLSPDFSRNGYLIANAKLYNFYDAGFNYRKQLYTSEPIFCSSQTHKPFRKNLIIEQVYKTSSSSDEGMQVRLIDSSLHIIKKAIIYPDNFQGDIFLPSFGGVDIKDKNEMWATAIFGLQPNLDFSIYSLTKLDSNLNIVCQHFLGYDTPYIIYGIKSFDSGGAIVYGNRVKDGLGQNEGEDIFAIRVGENCELPATVSTNGPATQLISISAYPNPGINDLTFSVNGFDPATLRVEFIDELGQVLFTEKDLTNSIQVPQLPAGQYFYRILQND